MTPSRPASLCAPPNRQAGMGMISVLIALIILSFGILGLASMYAKTVPMPLQDRMAQRAAAAGQAFWATLQADPQAWNSAAFSNLSSAPSALTSWATQLQNSIPGVNATAVVRNDALGNACSANSCGVKLTITWNQFGGIRQQVFYENFGF